MRACVWQRNGGDRTLRVTLPSRTVPRGRHWRERNRGDAGRGCTDRRTVPVRVEEAGYRTAAAAWGKRKCSERIQGLAPHTIDYKLHTACVCLPNPSVVRGGTSLTHSACPPPPHWTQWRTCGSIRSVLLSIDIHTGYVGIYYTIYCLSYIWSK